MCQPAAEDLINLTFSPTDNLSIGLQRNSGRPYKSSCICPDFNIDMNKTVDLNKYDERIKASGSLGTVLEPFDKYTFDCTNQTKIVPRRLSDIESLESDDSLGILPELLSDQMTFDHFKSGLISSDDNILDEIDPATDENDTSIFSPLNDNQFNKINLFLKNISTPLPNFGNPRRYSSTPKISTASKTIKHISPPHFLPDEPEPIIAGSCHIKYKADFNLDDLKNEMPLTSTNKTFSPLLPSILNGLNEETDFKYDLNFKENPERVENNLNVTQTLSRNVEDLFTCQHEENIQNVNLNNTFQIKPLVSTESADAGFSIKYPTPCPFDSQAGLNNSMKAKVKALDTTIAISGEDIGYNADYEKTFVIDFNSTVGTEISSMSKDRVLNETHVLETGSIQFCSNTQENIVNVTFTKDLEHDTPTNVEHQCDSSHGAVFKPKKKIMEETFLGNDLKLNPILEETFSENDSKTMEPGLEKNLYINDLNKIKVNIESVQCINGNQSAYPETLKNNENITFSEKVNILPLKETLNESYQIEFDSPNFLKGFADGNKTNLTQNENDSSFKKSKMVSLQSGCDTTFSEEICERINQEDDKLYKIVNAANEFPLPKSLKIPEITFNEKVNGEVNHDDKVDLNESKNGSNEVLDLGPLQSIENAISNSTVKKSYQDVDIFNERDSIQSKNSDELTSFILPEISKSLILFDKPEATSISESSVFQDSNEAVEISGSKSQAIFSRNTNNLNFNHNDSHAVIKVSKAFEGSILPVNTSDETEFCTDSIPKEDSAILSDPFNMHTSNAFSEKSNFEQNEIDSISSENHQGQLTQDLLKEIANATFSEKIGIEIEPISIINENDEFQPHSNPEKEINASFSKLADEDMKIQPVKQMCPSNVDSKDETASPSTKKFNLKSTIARKVVDKLNSSLKNCSIASKTVVKSGLIKPTKVVYPRKVTGQHNGQLPVNTPSIDKNFNFNCTLNLSDTSKDKSFSKNFNRRFSLSCSNASDAIKHVEFKKPFGIPSKLGLKRPESNFQKPKFDTKYSSGRTVTGDQILTQPDLISSKNPELVKSVAVATIDEKRSISSMLSQKKLPINSLKIRERVFKTDTALAYTPEKSNKVISPTTVVKLPKKEKVCEIGKSNVNSRTDFSRHSIATNLPRKILPCNNISNIACPKPVIEQNSVSASNSYKPDSLKVPDNMKLSNSVTGRRFSVLPKFQSNTKVSSGVNEKRSEGSMNKKNGFLMKPCASGNEVVQSVGSKSVGSVNQKSNGVLMKPRISGSESVHLLETQISTNGMKQKDNKRENVQVNSSVPALTKQVAKPLNSLGFKKSNGQCNFSSLPQSGIKSLNSNIVQAAQSSELQNQVGRRTSGKLPQLRRITAPFVKK